MVRDARTRNITARETIRMWDSVRRGEEQYIFPFQDDADIMFNSALIYELAVLKQYAEPLLFQIGKECPEYTEAKRLLKFLDYFLPVPSEDVAQNSILREFVWGVDDGGVTEDKIKVAYRPYNKSRKEEENGREYGKTGKNRRISLL